MLINKAKIKTKLSQEIKLTVWYPGPESNRHAQI